MEEFTVDYRLYQSFWRLQEYAFKQDAVVKGDGAKAKWKAILDDVDKVHYSSFTLRAILVRFCIFMYIYILGGGAEMGKRGFVPFFFGGGGGWEREKGRGSYF